MSTTAIINARILTMAAPSTHSGPRRGPELAMNNVIPKGWVSVAGDRITGLGFMDTPMNATPDTVIDAQGRVVMPGLVDCHTHGCWTGDRSDEFEARLAGTSYLDILAAGGGIMSTVRSVRNATRDELRDNLLLTLQRMARLGITSVEVKSGYGLEIESELRMLRAIADASEHTDQILVPTFLGAHALDADATNQDDAINHIIHEALPAVAKEFPGIACDAYCEEGAWSLDDCIRLFTKAQELGCPIRVHTDQFNSLGMTRKAVEMGARSVDHLEASTPEDIAAIASSSTIGVLLPISGLCVDDRYAPGRELIDQGAAVAIASNSNPGSAQSPSLPLAIALACRKCGLTPSEALTAATWNAACVLGMENEIGSVEVGTRADLIMLDSSDERILALDIAHPGPIGVMLAGQWHDLNWR